MTLAAVEYGVCKSGYPATLRAASPGLMFASPAGWNEAEADMSNSMIDSRVLIKSAERGQSFFANVVIQYFDFRSPDVLRLSVIDTEQDILKLSCSQLFTHYVLVS